MGSGPFPDSPDAPIVGEKPDAVPPRPAIHPCSEWIRGKDGPLNMIRIATGGIRHETNTFSEVATTLEDFERDSPGGADFSGGETILCTYQNTGTIHGGYIDACEEDAEIELLPLLSAQAQPSGLIENEAFEFLTDLFLSRLEAELPVDGVALDLHGAMVTSEFEDAEGEFVTRVRTLVGPTVPIAVTLDLHANITRKLVNAADIVIGFDTYPHVDMRERGHEAVSLLARSIRTEVRPVIAFRQLPLITLPPMQCTLREPMMSIMDEVHEEETEPEILSVTLSMGFPFADIQDAGASVVVVGNSDRRQTEETAERIANRAWSARDAFSPELTKIEEVIKFARRNEDGLTIFADGSDNPGGDAPSDGTVALRALIEAEFEGAVVGLLADRETVAQAHQAGVGSEIDAVIGGKTDDRHGEPVAVKAYVRSLSDGNFTHRGPMNQGAAGSCGRMAVLVASGVEIVLSEFRRQLLDAEMLRIVGISPEHRRLLVVKSAVHFRADLGPLAAHIFDADTPGIHRPDFSQFRYHRLRRPIYPLDEMPTELPSF